MERVMNQSNSTDYIFEQESHFYKYSVGGLGQGFGRASLVKNPPRTRLTIKVISVRAHCFSDCGQMFREFH